MKLILRADVENLGNLGDVVTVKPGYGRNFLLPQGLAMVASEANMKAFELERKKLQERMDALRADAQALCARLEALEVVIPMHVGDNDKLYGSVTSSIIGDALTALAGLEDNWRAEANKAPSARQKVYLDLLSLTAQWHGELSGSTPFSALKACYQRSVADLQAEVAETQKKLGDLLRFLQEAFGKGTELSMAVNDLTVAPVATAFLGQFLSTDYFAASRDLLLHRQSEQLLHQIDLTGLV